MVVVDESTDEMIRNEAIIINQDDPRCIEGLQYSRPVEFRKLQKLIFLALVSNLQTSAIYASA